MVWYSLSKVSITKVIEYAQNADYTWIGLGVFLGLLSHLSRSYRWLFMLEPMGYKIKFGNSIMAVFATYLINYTIPRAGEVARASILTNYEGVPFEKGFGTIVAERIADMLVMLSIIAITLFLQFDFIYGFLIEKFNPVKIGIALGICILLGLLFLRLLNIKIDAHNFGYVGLLGIYILLIYSYLSNLIIAHFELHNLLVLIFGITAFIFSTYKKYLRYK